MCVTGRVADGFGPADRRRPRGCRRPRRPGAGTGSVRVGVVGARAWQTLAGVSASIPTLQPIWAASSDTQQLWSIVALLVVLGIGLVMAAVAVFKATRPDRELLAPLEVMGRRKWRRSDPVFQRRELDAVRPPNAQPLSPAPAWPEPLPDFDEGPVGFRDLHGELASAPDGAVSGADDEVDAGLDDALTELPGGEVFDADPTPPSREVAVIVPHQPPPEVPLAVLGAPWDAPAPEDVSAPAEAPLLGEGGSAHHVGVEAAGAPPAEASDAPADGRSEQQPEPMEQLVLLDDGVAHARGSDDEGDAAPGTPDGA